MQAVLQAGSTFNKWVYLSMSNLSKNRVRAKVSKERKELEMNWERKSDWSFYIWNKESMSKKMMRGRDWKRKRQTDLRGMSRVRTNA